MKEKIIELINTVKSIFANRRSRMPAVRFHKVHIQALSSDEAALEDANQTIQSLEMNKQFAAIALFYLMEKVVPVFRNWLARIKAIETAHRTDVSGHIIAKQEFEAQAKETYALLAQMNGLEDQVLIAIDPNQENPGKAMIKQYQREKYLCQHKIQLLNVTNDEDLYSAKEMSFTL